MLNANFACSQSQQKLIAQHKLPASFCETIAQWYFPLATQIASVYDQTAQQNSTNLPLIIGIQGCQGSGKSTLAAFLALILDETRSLQTLALSLDDFYLTREDRKSLAQTIHPLLATRGVPGTHDIDLACQTLQNLKEFSSSASTRVPRFNKATDDRHPETEWLEVNVRPDIILLEGWCVKLTAENDEAMEAPVNALEQNEDKQAIWRRYANEALKNDYPRLFSQLNKLIVLQAPSFDCVFQWRLLQENKLIATLNAQHIPAHQRTTMSPKQIERFISHYQRLSQHALKTLPEKADWIVFLDGNHEISRIQDNHSRQSPKR